MQLPHQTAADPRALALEVDVDTVKLGLSAVAVVVQIAENFPAVFCHQKLRVVVFPAAGDALGQRRDRICLLDDRSRRIIEARWLREDDDAATLQELADEYGVSAERIRQIESKALKTMRSQMVTLQ